VETFESFVAPVMEHEGLVVSPAVKFDVTRQTRKTAHEETQTDGFEVDLVGPRRPAHVGDRELPSLAPAGLSPST
jgi:hypothetical protein